MKRLLLICLLLATPLLAQQSPALPQRDQVTTQDLKDQIADCAITSRNSNQYEAKLIARIRELEKEVAELKAAK